MIQESATDTVWRRIVRATPWLAGVLSVLLGLVVLLGWVLGSPRIVQIFAGLTPMQGNTALSFVMVGGALLSSHHGLRRIAFGLASTSLMLALLVFSQYLWNIPLGIDEILFRHVLPTFHTSTPGRMAPNTAVAFTLASLAALLLIVRRGAFGGALMGCLVFTLGFVSLVGFSFGIGHAMAWGDANKMAFHTSLGLVLLGAGLVAEAFRQHPEREQATIRRGAMLAGVTTALIGVLFWQALREREEQQIGQLVAQVSAGVQRELTKRLRSTVSAVELLSRQGAELGWESASDWRMDAAIVVGALPEIDSVQWLDTEFQSQLTVAAGGHPRRIRDDEAARALDLEALHDAREGLRPVVTGPFNFVDGSGAIRAMVPLLGDGVVRAFLVANIPVAELFAAMSRNVASGYNIRVWCQDREVFRSPAFFENLEAAHVQTSPLSFPGSLPWKLEVRPQPRLVSQLGSSLPEAVLATGLALSLLIGSTLWFGENANLRARQFEIAVADRTRELERAMDSLKSENEQRRRSEGTLQRTLAVSRLVSAEHDLTSIVQAVTDAITQLTGAAIASFYYNVVSPSGETYTLYALSGVDEDLFTDDPTPRKTPFLAPTFDGQQVVRCDDVRLEPSYGNNEQHRGLPAGHPLSVVSYMAVPVVSRSGKVWGGVLCGHPEPGVFTSRDEELAVGLASHAATAMDKAELLEAERKARSQAQAASVAKDQFLAVVSHELRNPLGAVRSALEVLGRGAADPAADVRMRRILTRQVAQLARLVDDLLDVSRMTRGLVKLKLKRLDLVDLVRHVVGASRARVETKGLQLIESFVDRPLWVDADPARIMQALDNVLANAEKFTDAGGVIEVVVSGDDREANVRVIDNGTGLRSEELEHIFEPFEQVGRDMSHGTGLGLGLAIFKGLIEAHHGTVAATSTGLGQGSEFSFRLPLQDAPEVLATAGESAPVRSRRVLLIDDHVDSLEGLSELLGVLGHDVRTACDGTRGIELARRDPPDVVVCDIGLPDLDGYQVARAMRDHPSTASIRLIALTGFGDDKSITRAREAGFDHHLTKPVDVQALGELLSAASVKER